MTQVLPPAPPNSAPDPALASAPDAPGSANQAVAAAIAADAASGRSTAPRPLWRRIVRGTLGLVAALLVLLLVLGGGAWWWAGTEQSLAALLTRAARYLPADQSLQTRNVTGSVRAGGHIAWLRWQSPTLAVEVQEIDIGCSSARNGGRCCAAR